jgi:hypothetical protein
LSFMEFVNYYLIECSKLYIDYTPATVYQHCERLENRETGLKIAQNVIVWASILNLNSVQLLVATNIITVTS